MSEPIISSYLMSLIQSGDEVKLYYNMLGLITISVLDPGGGSRHVEFVSEDGMAIVKPPKREQGQ